MNDKINDYALELWKLVERNNSYTSDAGLGLFHDCDTLQKNYIFSQKKRDEYLACVSVISNTDNMLTKIVFDYNIVKGDIESHYYFELKWDNNTPNINIDFYEIVFKDGSLPMVNEHIKENTSFTELTIAKIVNEVNKRLK